VSRRNTVERKIVVEKIGEEAVRKTIRNKVTVAESESGYSSIRK